VHVSGLAGRTAHRRPDTGYKGWEEYLATFMPLVAQPGLLHAVTHHVYGGISRSGFNSPQGLDASHGEIAWCVPACHLLGSRACPLRCRGCSPLRRARGAGLCARGDLRRRLPVPLPSPLPVSVPAPVPAPAQVHKRNEGAAARRAGTCPEPFNHQRVAAKSLSFACLHVRRQANETKEIYRTHRLSIPPLSFVFST